MIIAYLFFFFYNLHKVLCDDIISIPIAKETNPYQSEFAVKDLYWKIKFNINMGIEYTYLNKGLFKRFQQYNEQTVSVVIKNNSFVTNTYNTDLSFGGHTLKDYFFVIIPEKQYVRNSGSIGLSYKVSNTSFIMRLFQEGLIQHLTFCFYHYDKDNYISFGGLPPQLISKKSKAVTSVDDRDIFWGIKLTEFYFGDRKFNYINDKYAFINVDNDRIFAPDNVMDHIANTVFSDYIANKTCRYNQKKRRQYINCQCLPMRYFPNMTFVIDGYLIVFTAKELFLTIQSKSNCLFLIQRSFEEGDENMWYFGNYFLSRFDTEFNYDEHTITFYSDEEIQMRTYDYKGYIKYSLSIVISVSIVAIILTIYNLCYINKQIGKY